MTENQTDLKTCHCKPCEGGGPPLQQEIIEEYLSSLPGWELADGKITRRFEFKNYYQTLAFVNAVAWIAHTENHHPDMEVSYRFCIIHFATHSVGGLSDNDFISAAKVNALPLPS